MSERADLVRALGALCEPPDPRHGPIAAALGLPGEPADGDYAEVFLFGAYPYASVYLGAEGMLGGDARDRVAGFWRALGLTPPAEPDHLAALLGLYAALAEAEDSAPDPARRALCRVSRKALLWEHLLSWLPPYLGKVAELAPPYYAAWARLLDAVLRDEAADLGPLPDLPLQLRAAPGLPAPDEPHAAWMAALLSAVRTGVVLTRADLRRGARELGLGSRVAERSFMLRSMLEQDAPATAAWLAAEASRWTARHQANEAILGRVAAFWQTRAEATHAALRSLELAAPAAARDGR